MPTPFERILRHEPALPGANLCGPCHHGILNTPCDRTDCGCACNLPPVTQATEAPDANMTFELGPQKEIGPFYYPGPEGEGWGPTEAANITSQAEEGPAYIEAQIHVDPKPGILLLLGTLLGTAAGTAAAYPSIPLAARITICVVLAFVLVFLLAHTVERNEDAGS